MVHILGDTFQVLVISPHYCGFFATFSSNVLVKFHILAPESMQALMVFRVGTRFATYGHLAPHGVTYALPTESAGVGHLGNRVFQEPITVGIYHLENTFLYR